MADDQRAARWFGVLFIITFITSIAALALFQSVLDDPAGYIAGGGKDNQIYLGAFLEFLLVLANVGTAVVLYPIARRQNEYPRHRLRRCSDHRVRLHCGGDHLRSRRSHPPPGLSGRGRPCRLPRRAQGLDVPLRPRTRRPLRERADPRLPDVPLPPRPPSVALARTDRRAAAPVRQLRRALRLVGPDWLGERPRDPGVHLGGVPGHLLRDLGISA